MPSDGAWLPEDLDPFDAATIQTLTELEELTPGFFADVVQTFKLDVRRRLDNIREALAAADAEALWSAAHALKSSCGSIGAMRMWTLSQTLEEQGRAHRLSGAEQLADQLGAEFERAQHILEERAKRFSGPTS